VATKVVHVSDLSGREAEDEGQLGRLVVLEHPDIGEPATLEVFPDEVADLENAERLVRLEYYPPGERRAQQLTVTAEQFNSLAKGEDMRALLVRAITTAHERRGEGAQPARAAAPRGWWIRPGQGQLRDPRACRRAPSWPDH
jgi:hypothetical protein